MVVKFVESIKELNVTRIKHLKKNKNIIANNDTLSTSETPFVRLRIKILLIFCFGLSVIFGLIVLENIMI